MTPLDAAVVALLVLVGAGGYQQGLIRGLTRLGALAVIAPITLVLAAGIDGRDGPRTMLLRTLALCGGVVLLVGIMTWLINRAVPSRWHDTRLNKLLGVLPALVQGLTVAALVLGLAHRLALEQEMQHYLARGMLTGQLIQPVSWLEQTLARVR